MALDSKVNRDELIRYFPDLASDNHFHLLSDATRKYNCIGWAMGSDERWVTSAFGADYWWPDGVDRDSNQDSLVKAFEAVGFSICADSTLEAGFDKVALYAREGQWTHAARIISDEEEYSKFGTGWDATHGHDVFDGTNYGSVFCYMKRPVADRHITKDMMGKIGIVKVLKKLSWK